MRSFLFNLILSMASTLIFFSVPVVVHAEQIKPVSIDKKLSALENSFDGKIGLSAINTKNNARVQYRAFERFPFQSTFKMMVVAAILKQSMTDSHLLQQRIRYTKEDMVFWSPITEKHFADGMTIFDLCAASMMYSDNIATNLLVKKLGGPDAVVAFARSIGDNSFRLNGWEAELNSDPNDLHDTSTPAAMEKSLQKLTLEHVLAPSQQKQLVDWMKGNTTGDARIRAGVPKGWIVADKTGGAGYGMANDIGIVWAPDCAPIIVSIYTVQNKKDALRRDDIVASAARLVMSEFAQGDQCIKQHLI